MNEFISLHRVDKIAPHCFLQNVNLRVFEGRINTVLSNDNALSEALCALIRGESVPDNGRICIYAQPVLQYDAETAKQFGIYTVFQNSNMFLRNSIADNMFVIGHSHLSLKPISYSRLKQRASKLIAHYGMAEAVAVETPLYKCSETRCHIIEILRAVARGAKLIICENIFDNITGDEMDELIRVILKLKENGITVLLFVSRYCRMLKISDHITLVRNGTTAYNMNRDSVDERSVATALSGGIINRMEESLPYSVAKDRVLSLRGIKSDGAICDMRFDLFKGERLGLLDTYMTTCDDLVDILCHGGKGQGVIEYMGQSFNLDKTHPFPPNAIACLSEKAAGCEVFHNLSLYDNVIITIPRKLKMPLSNVSSRVYRYIFQSAMQAVHAEGLVRKIGRCKKLPPVSIEDRWRILFARCLCAKVKVIIWIDTHSNRSPEYTTFLHGLFNDVCNSGLSIIVISSDLPFLTDNTDRILYVEDRKIVGHIDHD